jgi:ABC-type dipeptide/oligopeptide/nickel transport system ATPase component
MNADKIVVIQSGQVVEEGTHSELLAKRGHYYDLLNVLVNQIRNIFPRNQNRYWNLLISIVAIITM